MEPVRWLKLVKALWVAFLVRFGDEGWRGVWPGVVGFCRAMRAWWWGGVDERVRERMESCRRCPLYHEGKGTCGWDGGPVDASGKAMGCLCYMPLKSRLGEAECWLWEQGVGGGWREGMNGPA